MRRQIDRVNPSFGEYSQLNQPIIQVDPLLEVPRAFTAKAPPLASNFI